MTVYNNEQVNRYVLRRAKEHLELLKEEIEHLELRKKKLEEYLANPKPNQLIILPYDQDDPEILEVGDVVQTKYGDTLTVKGFNREGEYGPYIQFVETDKEYDGSRISYILDPTEVSYRGGLGQEAVHSTETTTVGG